MRDETRGRTVGQRRRDATRACRAGLPRVFGVGSTIGQKGSSRQGQSLDTESVSATDESNVRRSTTTTTTPSLVRRTHICLCLPLLVSLASRRSDAPLLLVHNLSIPLPINGSVCVCVIADQCLLVSLHPIDSPFLGVPLVIWSESERTCSGRVPPTLSLQLCPCKWISIFVAASQALRFSQSFVFAARDLLFRDAT